MTRISESRRRPAAAAHCFRTNLDMYVETGRGSIARVSLETKRELPKPQNSSLPR